MNIRRIIPLIALSFIWGCYYVASQQMVNGLSVFSAGVVIRVITFVLLLLYMAVRKELPLLKKVRGVLPRMLLIGILGFLLDLTAFLGLMLSSAGSGTALLKCDIIFVNLISMILYKTKFSKQQWFYSLVMLGGVFLVMNFQFSNFTISDKGNLFFILSALFVSINAFLIKSVQLDHRNPVSDRVIAFYNNAVTLLLFLITSLILGTLGQIKDITTNSKVMIASIVAGFGQFCIYWVYYWNLRHFPVWIVKVFLLLMPIVATTLSFLLFSERMIIKQYIGIVIVLGGALGILMEQRKVNKQ